MVSFNYLVLVAAAAARVFSAPTDLALRSTSELAKRQTITASQTGTSNGYYYQLCKKPSLLIRFICHRFNLLKIPIISTLHGKSNSPCNAGEFTAFNYIQIDLKLEDYITF